MIKNLGLELQESVDKWEQLGKDLEQLIPASMPKSDAAITQTPLPLLEEWATETEKQLNPLMRTDKRDTGNMQARTTKLQATFGRPQKR